MGKKHFFSVSITSDSLEQAYKNNPEQKKNLNESLQGERLAKTGMSLAKFRRNKIKEVQSLQTSV